MIEVEHETRQLLVGAVLRVVTAVKRRQMMPLCFRFARSDSE
jgi:hypothetical protein